MMLLLSFISFACVFIAFLTHPISHQTFYLAYYSALGTFFVSHIGLSIIGVGIFLGLFIRAFHLPTIVKNIPVAILQLVASVLVGSFLGLVILLVIAFVQLNVLVILIDNNPAWVGVITDKNTIVKELAKSPTPPDILATADSQEREVVGVAQNTTGTNQVYGGNILPAIPNLLILPMERHLSSMILSDNTLIITKINASDLQAVGKILGYAYVKHYFSDRSIKQNPKISIMDSSQYVKHREAMVTQRTKDLDNEIQLVEDKISSLSAGIQHDQDELTNAQQQADQQTKDLDTQYRKCINAGEYQNGKYIHYYSESYCQTQQDNFAAESGDPQKDIKVWSDLLAYDQNQLTAYKEYVNFFKAQKIVAQIGKANLPDELGVFEAPDSIQIALETNDSHAVADYVETLVHEYLHYTSFISGKKLSSSFFEEGLTEYFARQAIQDSLHVSTNVGYPVQVKIITALTQRIDESELADVYFSKDEDQLEKMLDRVYGDGFYAKNISLFQTLMYTADPAKELQIANKIMKQIGGPELKKTDLESTFGSM